MGGEAGSMMAERAKRRPEANAVVYHPVCSPSLSFPGMGSLLFFFRRRVITLCAAFADHGSSQALASAVAAAATGEAREAIAEMETLLGVVVPDLAKDRRVRREVMDGLVDSAGWSATLTWLHGLATKTTCSSIAGLSYCGF